MGIHRKILNGQPILDERLEDGFTFTWDPTTRTASLSHPRGLLPIRLKGDEAGVIIRLMPKAKPDMSTLVPPKDANALIPWQYGFTSKLRERRIHLVKVTGKVAIVRGPQFLFTYEQIPTGITPSHWAVEKHANPELINAHLASSAARVVWR